MTPETAKWAASLPDPGDKTAWDERLREVFKSIAIPMTPPEPEQAE